MPGIPAQRRPCDRYAWCTTPARGHTDHVGEAYDADLGEGVVLRVSLGAEGAAEPRIQIEAAFGAGQPFMEVAGIDPASALELAGRLLRLARTADRTDQEVPGSA